MRVSREILAYRAEMQLCTLDTFSKVEGPHEQRIDLDLALIIRIIKAKALKHSVSNERQIGFAQMDTPVFPLGFVSAALAVFPHSRHPLRAVATSSSHEIMITKQGERHSK